MRSRPSLQRLVTVSVALASAWWVVALPPFSYRATVAVLAVGGAATVAGARNRRPQRVMTDGRSLAAWAVLIGAAGVWQLAAFLQHPRDDHPTLSSLANALLDSHPARAAGFVLWVVGAFELARR